MLVSGCAAFRDRQRIWWKNTWLFGIFERFTISYTHGACILDERRHSSRRVCKLYMRTSESIERVGRDSREVWQIAHCRDFGGSQGTLSLSEHPNLRLVCSCMQQTRLQLANDSGCDIIHLIPSHPNTSSSEAIDFTALKSINKITSYLQPLRYALFKPPIQMRRHAQSLTYIQCHLQTPIHFLCQKRSYSLTTIHTLHNLSPPHHLNPKSLTLTPPTNNLTFRIPRTIPFCTLTPTLLATQPRHVCRLPPHRRQMPNRTPSTGASRTRTR